MDHENRPNRPPSEQMVDLHVYVVPPALWQERLHSAFNQIIGETVSAGFIRVFPESLLQQVRSDIERQLGYEIVPRNFVFCKSVGRCLTQVRSRQEKELKAKHFLPPHAYCPEIFVLDYDIARRSQSSSDGSIASNRSYPNHHSLLQQQPPQSRQRPSQQQPPQLQTFDSPRQTVYHGRTPKVAHKGVTGVYIGPYPMQSYPGLGSRPGTADSQSRSPAPFDSGLEIDYEELDRERLRRIKEEADAKRRLAELEARRKAEEEEERRRREEEERRRLEEEERRRRQEDEERRKREDEERRKREDEERRKREDEERRKREDEERRKREDEERRKREDEERRKREDEERRRRQEEEELQRRLEEEERRRRQEEEDERRWREEEAERQSADKKSINKSERNLPDEESKERVVASGDGPGNRDENRAVAMATKPTGSQAPKQENKQELAEEEAEMRRREEEENEIDGMVPSLLIEEATSIDPQEEMRRGREQLLSELQRVRDERAEIERRRDDLIRRARQLQSRTQNMRNQGLQSLAARDMWKKRYFEEKKLTTPLEDQANRLRDELEVYHKRMVSTMTSRVKEGKNIDTPDATQQLNLRIQATRMQHEIEELQRRVDDSKMKLTAEVKLRTQAEAELRAMKAELTQRKLNLSMTRTQQMGQMVS